MFLLYYIIYFGSSSEELRGEIAQMIKKRGYNERVLQFENGTFTPLVFSVHGGMGPECKVFYKRMSFLISEKRRENFAFVSSWIRTRISFAFLRSAIMCLKGSRNLYFRSAIAEVDMELDITESKIRPLWIMISGRLTWTQIDVFQKRYWHVFFGVFQHEIF